MMASAGHIAEPDVVIVGAGAAGLMAGIWAARSAPGRHVLLLDGAKKLGAKILVAGGGRCNVTHEHVDTAAYAGASRNAIKKVIRRFDVPATVAFFRELGVELKREETGKLFPTTDSSRTVLNALLRGVHDAGAEIQFPRRVTAVTRTRDGRFNVAGAWGRVVTPAVVLATGGRSLPKSGSDGFGYTLAQSFGHTITPRTFPALVPLTLPRDHFLCQLRGIAVPATLTLCEPTGKQIKTFTNSVLCTHFGLSGPGVLDMSRYYIAAQTAVLTVNWLPTFDAQSFEQALLQLGARSPLSLLREQLPDRLARALCVQAGIDPGKRGDQLRREERRALVQVVTQLPLPVTGNRGYNYAEVTAGGVPLTEIQLKTMASRICPGLYFCGEICNVDGQIGGYNFQWAWASGYVAGVSVGVATAAHMAGKS